MRSTDQHSEQTSSPCPKIASLIESAPIVQAICPNNPYFSQNNAGWRLNLRWWKRSGPSSLSTHGGSATTCTTSWRTWGCGGQPLADSVLLISLCLICFALIISHRSQAWRWYGVARRTVSLCFCFSPGAVQRRVKASWAWGRAEHSFDENAV